MKTFSEIVTLGDVRLEVNRVGSGPSLLLLPGEDMLEKDSAFVEKLAKSYEVIIPSPPGFGRSDRPDWIVSIDDVSYLYLDLLDTLGLKTIPVLGFSLGGWIAAEVATKSCERIAKLALVAPYGIKPGAAMEQGIADIWALEPAKVAALKWFDPVNGKRDYAAMPDDELAIIARNNETLVRLCWSPYMHNPQLRWRLRRISVPTMVLWGEQDGIVTSHCGKTWMELVSDAQFATISQAGHYPHLEQPARTLEKLKEFLA